MSIDFGGRLVGPEHATYVVAELGYSWCITADHKRNLAELDALVDAAADAGADCVKVQIRSLDASGYYATKGELLDKPIDDPASPWRTRMQFVRMREPTREVLDRLDARCSARGIQWTASAWDLPSLDLLASYSPPWVKVASASLTDRALLGAVAALGLPVVMSTGMATTRDISGALEALGDLYPGRVLLAHTTSSYPCPDDDVNLRALDTLRRYMVPVGYSGHEDGIALTFAAVVMGACWVERHFTLSRSHWHKDHRASLEPPGMTRLVRDVRRYERALGDGIKRVMPSEEPFLSLRRVSA